MARYTKAYSGFSQGLVEVKTLCKLAALREKRDPIKCREEINALSRGSIVLLSGRLEGYIRDLGEVTLESMYEKSVPRTALPARLYYHISRDIIERIKDASNPESIGNGIFSFIDRDLSYWSHVGPFPQRIDTERYSKGFTNPKFERIKKYFARFGYDEYRRDLEIILKHSFVSTVNVVDHLVDTRNKIAHGDLGPGKTAMELANVIEDIRGFCQVTDSAFASWCKKTICAIR